MVKKIYIRSLLILSFSFLNFFLPSSILIPSFSSMLSLYLSSFSPVLFFFYHYSLLYHIISFNFIFFSLSFPSSSLITSFPFLIFVHIYFIVFSLIFFSTSSLQILSFFPNFFPFLFFFCLSFSRSLLSYLFLFSFSFPCFLLLFFPCYLFLLFLITLIVKLLNSMSDPLPLPFSFPVIRAESRSVQ